MDAVESEGVFQDESLWTHEKEDILVTMWQERPCLFSIRSPEYSDGIKRCAAIGEIVEVLGMTGTFTGPNLNF